MLIAASLTVTLAASAPAAAAPPAALPVIVHVIASADVPVRLRQALLAEADAIWDGTGVRFLWQQEDRHAAGRGGITPQTPYGSPVLRVVIGDETHLARDPQVPLGWIVFDDATTPEREIYVSYRNALFLLERSPGIVGASTGMPRAKREVLLARAMGRALAHELGHFLSASKTHARSGLMMAMHSAAEFFGTDRRGFALAPAERQRIVARYKSAFVAKLSGGNVS
jgi:hypothetical protein